MPKSESPSALHVNWAYNPDDDETNTRSHPINHEDKVANTFSSSINKITYTWENMQVYADVSERNCFGHQKKGAPVTTKCILNNVTGCVRPGEFLAMMGASGAGKTTLLNCLTFRNKGKLQVSGKRCINGSVVDTGTLARISAYVQQDDLFIGFLTVNELLRFQALLRMDKHISYKDRMKRVEEVTHELGLTKCSNTMIGDPSKGIKGISGGERKRLAFACEILTDPPLLFCDEPTSGLDSFMAQNIVQALRNLTSRGKTVICTIHQPSSEVFAMFDRICLLAEGRTAFLGTIDQALTFFSQQGYPCPDNFNPADFYIYSLAIVPGNEDESKARAAQICDAFESSERHFEVLNIVQESNQVANLVDIGPVNRSPYKASWWTQFKVVFWRSLISIIKNPQVVLAKLLSAVFISGLIALIFQGQDSHNAKDVMNIQGALFLYITNSTFETIFGVVNSFATEVPIFLREHFNGMYRTDVYFLCKTFAELPLYIIAPFISVSITYFAIGFNGDIGRFFICVGIIILVVNVATSFGYFVSCLSSNPEIATALAAPMILPALLFGGFFLNNGAVPIYFDWLRYLSWFMYSNEALSINQWTGVKFEYNNTVIENICKLPNHGKTLCTGEDVLDLLNFEPDYFYRDIGALVALIVGFRLLAFGALLIKSRRIV